eukprot:218565_1
MTEHNNRLKHECDRLKSKNTDLQSDKDRLQTDNDQLQSKIDLKGEQNRRLRPTELATQYQKAIALKDDHGFEKKATDLKQKCDQLEQNHKEQMELISELRTRLSEYSSALDLSRGFPPVQDIVNEFGSLKSQSHQRAGKQLKKALKQRHKGYHKLRNHKCVCEILFDILMKSYRAMKQFADKIYSDIAVSNGLNIDNPKHMKRVETMVKEVHSVLIDLLKKDKARTILSEIKGLYKLDDCLKDDTKLLEYTEECIAICWVMALVRDPMLDIEPKK